MNRYDVMVIGGGIIGFSTAFQLLQRYPKLKVAVLEKESGSAQHQTGHNSGVIHSGVYYTPGSLKAKFCFQGCQQTKVFCQEHGVPFKVPGKLVVALNNVELERMKVLAERCQANGLTIEILNAEETQKAQPGIQAAGAIFVKDTGIVDWKQVTEKYAELFKGLGGDIYFNETVCDIDEQPNEVTIKTKSKNTYQSQYMIACAGLFADRIVKMSKHPVDFKIIPFRGEYYRLADQYSNYFRHLIYPVPDPALPFLGVHFTPQMAGFATVGPGALLALAREGYSWGAINPRDCLEIFTYSPTWKLIFKNFKSTLQELSHSLFKSLYLRQVHQYFPEIQKNDLIKYPAGVRAMAMNKKGELIDDFLFIETDRILHACNAPSPAATSSLPIGKYIVDRFADKL